MSEQEKVIYTDSDWAKDQIKLAYEGFKSHYDEYMMYASQGNKYNIKAIAGLNRYAISLFIEIAPKLDKFENDIGKENIDILENIFYNISIAEDKQYKILKTKLNLRSREYTFLMMFFSTFLEKTGMKELTKDKDDPRFSFGKM